MSLRRKPVIIYVGDDGTDEDAFRVLKKNALTVRVGRNQKTSAKYFVRNVTEVKRILRAITHSS